MMTGDVISIEGKNKLDDALAALGGVDVSTCYQCGKCATGCPVAYEMDLTPTQLMHAIQLGLEDLVYKSKTMWLCASCLTCSTRCPQDVDVAEVMDTVKILMQRNRKKPQVPDVLKFVRRFTENLKLFGRLHELSMAGMLGLTTFNFKDTGLAMKMFRKGKFRIFPKFGGAIAVRRLYRRAHKLENL
jgi:heterodisulfide reductase subunit C